MRARAHVSLRLHNLPYGTEDRPVYSMVSPHDHVAVIVGAKGRGGLVSLDVPGEGLWPKLAFSYSAASVSGAKRCGSYVVPSRRM